MQNWESDEFLQSALFYFHCYKRCNETEPTHQFIASESVEKEIEDRINSKTYQNMSLSKANTSMLYIIYYQLLVNQANTRPNLFLSCRVGPDGAGRGSNWFSVRSRKCLMMSATGSHAMRSKFKTNELWKVRGGKSQHCNQSHLRPIIDLL